MNELDGDDIGFAPEEPAVSGGDPVQAHWKLLVVDDEPEVHSVTALALRDFRYEGRSLALIHAYSGAECVKLMREQPDVAIILMDVVMETEHAGLDAVHAIRMDLKNRFVRIVLRTGQPGQAPEREILTSYDINDYKEKTELTSRKLFTMVYTILGYYRQLMAVESQRLELLGVVDELRRSNRDLSQFAYVASHDLAAPLRNIVGFSQLLEKRYGELLPQEGRDFLGFIVQSTRRMKLLIDDMLMLAQVGNRKNLASVKLEDCLDRALLALEEPIRTSGAEIRRSPLPTVRGVETELLQMLMNLVSNAVKFRRPAVPPVIDISGVEIHGGCEIRVSDNGIGVPVKQRDQLFQLFRRLHHDDEYEGTGVGLALCRKIAESHNGNIRLDDSPLGGTSVVVRLNTG